MIILYENTNETKNKTPLKIQLIDTHSHLGKEEVRDSKGKEYRIVRPKDHLDMYEKLKYDIYQRMNKYPEDFAFSPPEEADDFTQPTTLLQKNLYEKYRPSQDIGWLVDKTISFPLHDILLSKTTPHFVRSNNYILTRSQTFEYGSRIIPFCRIDPSDDAELAQEELRRCIKYGARGLKLHPLSEEWMEDIVSEKVISLIQLAVDHHLPVIFDCQNYHTAEEIHQVTQEVAERTKNDNFSIIIGHFGFDYSTPGMFEILEHPNIKTETSGMHGGDCAVFYKNCLNLTENWQSSVMFGTDHSYFSVPQASDHLCFLFSQEAKDLGITIEDLKKVCHLNAYHMLKLYWPEEILKRKGMKKVKVKNEDFSQILNCITTNELVNTLGKIAKESGIFYTIDFIFNPGQTQVYNDIYILNLFVEKKNLKRSFVVQQPEKTKVKISEITQIRKYVEKITSILQEKENPYPFSKKYLMDYLLRQTAYSSRQSESNE